VKRPIGSALVVLLAACSGGDADAGGSASSDDETTSTTEAPEVGLPESFAAEGSIDLDGFVTTTSALVSDSAHYDLVLDSDDVHLQVVRDGQDVYLRASPDAASASDRLFQQGTARESTAMAALLESASFGPFEDPAVVGGAEVVADALAELLLTDPAGLLDPDDVEVDEVFDVDLPDEVGDALADLELDEPEVEARAELDDDGVVEAVELRLTSDDVVVDIEVAYDDLGEVTVEDLELPTTSEIDLTPFVDEEELLVFTETPLLLPTAPPDGMVLTTALVIEAFESREGCEQVQIDFAPADEPFGDEFVEYFLIDKTCMNQFDSTAFDETTGAFPSRHGGFEVLVGTTVVQVAAGDARFDTAAFIASLAPVTPEVLVASVVPVPD
jgi:hypothetical protein